MKIREQVAKNIVINRKKLKLTQKDIGERIGVTTTTVSSWENAVNMPDLETIIKLSEIFGISVEDLCNVRERENASREEREISTFIEHLRALGYVVDILKADNKDLENDFGVIIRKGKDKCFYDEKGLKRLQGIVKNTVEFVIWKQQQEEN